MIRDSISIEQVVSILDKSDQVYINREGKLACSGTSGDGFTCLNDCYEPSSFYYDGVKESQEDIAIDLHSAIKLRLRYGFFADEYYEWEDRPTTKKMKTIRNGIQDYFANKGVIVDIKWTQSGYDERGTDLLVEFSPLLTKYYLYVSCNYIKHYASARIHNDDEKDIALQNLLTEINSHKKNNLAEGNYFQWCRIIHKRKDWLDDPRFSEYAKRYRFYKLERLLDD